MILFSLKRMHISHQFPEVFQMSRSSPLFSMNYETRAMLRFSIAALLPLPLLALASLQGGHWVMAALLYITVFTATVDRLIARTLPAVDGEEFPSADRLSVMLALGHLAILPVILWALRGNALSPAGKLALFVAAGQFMGQVSNANAHELIHRANRGLRRLGTAVYISLLFGHHASAHPLVHHKYVATDGDPNSAPLNMSFWSFLPHAWIGSFRAGLREETRRAKAAKRPAWRHPYIAYITGGAFMLFLVLIAFGVTGLLWYLALSAYATMQLLLSDYVQHYGLRRATGADGRTERVSARHSWNARHVWSSSLMLNAPRHSDHHARPARPYPGLELPKDAPMLPASLPMMAVLALFPRQWRRVMNPRVARIVARK